VAESRFFRTVSVVARARRGAASATAPAVGLLRDVLQAADAPGMSTLVARLDARLRELDRATGRQTPLKRLRPTAARGWRLPQIAALLTARFSAATGVARGAGCSTACLS